MLELARVLWLAPLGGGALARSLWRWHHVVACEGRRLIAEEARRIRGERDMAMERERTLKRGLASLRGERTSLAEQQDERLAEARAGWCLRRALPKGLRLRTAIRAVQRAMRRPRAAPHEVG